MLKKLLKVILHLLALTIIWVDSVRGQENKPASLLQVNNPSVTVEKPKGAYSANIKVNYIRTREATAPITDPATFKSAAYTSVKEATQYLDGLGRPLQTIVRQGSAGSKARDIVSTVLYDEVGREVFKYLPYVQTEESNIDDGLFKANPFNHQASYYGSLQYNPGLAGEQVYYSKTEFESSPLNRVTKTQAPGNNWAGSNRGISMEYKINNVEDAVRIWNITNTRLEYNVNKNIPWNVNLPVTAATGGTYGDGQLYETETSDEQGRKMVEYKDMEGRIILKKVQLDPDVSNKPSHDGWLCTYYVYDDLGLLRFVIPPKAVKKWPVDGTTPSETVINELCFRYEYDGRQRMIAKKVPGAGWVYMVYDKRDRLTYTQDAMMRNRNQWMATFYDALNRPKLTGVTTYNGATYNGTTYSSDRDGLQLFIDKNFNTGPLTTTAVAGNPGSADYITHFRESGRREYKASNSITINPGFESEVGAEFIAEITSVVSSENVTIQYNPLPPGNNFIALTITYYDDYNNTGKIYNKTFKANLDNGGNSFSEKLPDAASRLTKGLVTGTKVRVLENPTNLASGEWLETVNFYDDKDRVIQLQSENLKYGLDVVTNLYDFTGKVLSNYAVHNNPAASKTVRVKTNFLYDYGGRLSEVRKTVNENFTRLIAKNNYDEMGQLQTKNLGLKPGSPGEDYIEKLNYSYNIRGWLQGINRDYSRGSGEAWFGMELNYDWGFNTNQYNGNIAGTKWRSKGDGERRAFGYGYDNANRLLFGDFTQHNGSDYIDNTKINFDTWMGNGVNVNTAYDENGNILQMQQWGLTLNNSQQIDNLYYRYNDNSNKLKNVWDQFNVADTKLGDFRTSINHPDKTNTSDTRVDYTYDSNGNLRKDLNKDIGGASEEGVEYNHLNLPWKITVKNKGTIIYIYDAAGNKLEKRTQEPAQSKNTKTTYIGGYIYENDKLQFFGHEEGRVREKVDASNIVTGYNFDYFIKDHLGNVRMVLTDEVKKDVYPAASLEDAAVAVERAYYDIKVQDANIVNKSSYAAFVAAAGSNYPNNNGNPPYNNNPSLNVTAESQKLYKLNGANGVKFGLGITLKVMAGDNVDIRGKSFYHLNSGQTASNTYPVSSALLSLLTSFTGGSAVSTKGVTGSSLNSNTSTTTPLTDFLNKTKASSTTGAPKAGINWILFDEQFKPVSVGFDAVDGADNIKSHSPNTGTLRNGYLYVYCSDESNVDVFFDNLQLIHNRGALLEETHYYPFGLIMSGISSKAAGGLDNKFQYNGKEKQEKEFSDGSGLELYDYGARMYDAQTGRWCVPDYRSDNMRMASPYQSNLNNPVNMVDPDGEWAIYWHFIFTRNSYNYFGYSKSFSNRIAHYASLYADNPAGYNGVTFTARNRKWLVDANASLATAHGVSGKDAESWLTYRKDVNYSKTWDSQSESKHSSQLIHATRTVEEAESGLTSGQAVLESQQQAWGAIFKVGHKKGGENLSEEDLQELGLAIHALSDAEAHKGAIYSSGEQNEHNTLNDLNGNSTKAEEVTSSTSVVYGMLNGNYSQLKRGRRLYVPGINASQLVELMIGAHNNGYNATYDGNNNNLDLKRR